MQLFEGVNRLVSMEITKIGMLIYVVRGQRVMIDRDLAALYGVTTSNLNKAVSRNPERFPGHFMFQLSAVETRNWVSQIVIPNSALKMSLRLRPYAFTEQGVSSLSAVLKSKRAIRVYLEIMDAFVSMRRVLGNNKKLAQRMEKAEEQLSRHEGEISTLFEEIEALSNPSTGPRKNIGFSGEG